ncbi:hypothetical protein K435DRAFT_687081, partial [Dendrothele bispora CBS 962.96]
LYMPALFKVWKTFNSAVLDDRLLEVAGELNQEHVSGPSEDHPESKTQWKDVDI